MIRRLRRSRTRSRGAAREIEGQNARGGSDGTLAASNAGEGSRADGPSPSAVAPTPRRFPELRIGGVDLGMTRFEFVDRLRATSAPLVLEAFSLRTEGETRLLGEDPEEQDPVRLRLTGRVNPVIASIDVSTQIDPFAAQPRLQVEWALGGIRGEGLTELVPELVEWIDGSELTDGRFGGKLEATLAARRRHALDFDLGDGFGAHVLVSDVAFRSAAGGPSLAGFDRFETEVQRVVPKSGDVHVKQIECVKPRLTAVRRADGIHALGLRLKVAGAPPADGATDGEAPVDEDSDVEPVAEDEAPEVVGAPEERPDPSSAKAPAAATSEIRLDRLLVSGIDVTISDEVAQPPAIVPLRDLDFEVKGLTTRALEEERFVRFHATLGAGNFEVQPEESTELEERKLFEEVVASGRVGLFPEFRGWVKAGVGALDLANFRGVASDVGAELYEGIFDSRLDLRFAGDGTVAASSRFAFTDLRLSEPADGPISKFLGLPAPLDAVLFVLRDEDGSIEVPLSFTAGEEGIGMGQITKAGVVALSSVIASALASSPLRMAGALGNLVGGDEEPVEETRVVAFGVGGVLAGGPALVELEPLLERLLDDDTVVLRLRHALGSGDVAAVARRANPTPEDCLILCSKLRERREQLLTERQAALARARAAYAVTAGADARAMTRKLRRLDAELGNVEAALDRVLDLLRPGAERQAVRRTRDACIALGTARLAALRATLIERVGADAASRIEVQRPRFEEPGERQQGAIEVSTSVRKLQ